MTIYEKTSTTYAKNEARFWTSVIARTVEYFVTVEDAIANCDCEVKYQRGGWNGITRGVDCDTEFFIVPCVA